MLWCQGAQNIELSDHKLKSALHRMITMHAVADRQTDGRTNNECIAQSIKIVSNN